MLELPVRHLITSLAIPSIISMLCTSFYNMADTFFVSKIDTAATAAGRGSWHDFDEFLLCLLLWPRRCLRR